MQVSDSNAQRADAPANSTSSRLLRAAASLFRAKGYARSSTRELAAMLGIQKASLYHHIVKKEDLLYAVCVDALRRIIGEVEQAVGADDDPLARIGVLIATHLRVILADQDAFATALTELRELSGERRAEVLHLQDTYQRMVEQVLTEAQGAGAIRTDVDVRHQTPALLNLLNMTVFWFHPDGELTASQLAATLTTLSLDGMRATP